MHAELPRDIREKLVSWNHTQEYETAGFQDYASRLGGGQYEKVWDLGEPLHILLTPMKTMMPVSLIAGHHLIIITCSCATS